MNKLWSFKKRKLFRAVSASGIAQMKKHKQDDEISLPPQEVSVSLPDNTEKAQTVSQNVQAGEQADTHTVPDKQAPDASALEKTENSTAEDENKAEQTLKEAAPATETEDKPAEEKHADGDADKAEEANETPAQQEDDLVKVIRRANAEKRKKILFSFLRFLGVLAAIAVCVFYFINTMMDNSKFVVTFYAVSDTGLEQSLRIVHLSDLHLTKYGEDNCDLVDKISELSPDLICVTGDMITEYHADWDGLTSLCERLVKIAPTYYCYGNHEISEILVNKVDVKSLLEKTGVVVLNNISVNVTINSDALVLGGITQSGDGIALYSGGAMDTFMSKEGYHILLTHYPENFDGYLENKIDGLALCGHAHGGQIRLPIIGALYTPDQGFLPKLTEGKLTYGNMTLVISRGLGDSGNLPRINNIPELVVVDLYNH